MAVRQSASSASTEREMTSSLSAYFSQSSRTWGIEARHGPHQLAHMSTIAYFPSGMKSEILEVFRSVSATVKSV